MITSSPGTILLIVLSVFLNACAQLLLSINLKGKLQFSASQPVDSAMAIMLNPGIILAMAVYGVSILVWMFVLSKTDVSLAYPFLGLGFAFVAIISFLFLNEPLGLQKAAGILVVSIGIILLARS
ncbi:SMR family transporter [Aurantiacibacter poecillastricola]|uniref:SMR family transporter n=1 Tax=Aurantiacibacter poecillastricola TaxID=3064385 RepID=UPI00273FCE07|nr:SMR family transporter [Aurantiacibacter sp. 219JJ12-13]MDP5259984.1 SMR family transporter [Aurantiacibacter sp. 219JJ12-13]